MKEKTIHGADGRSIASRGLKGILFSALMFVPRDVPAEESDKSGFTLFHPTPAPAMREMNADRPDKTESPFTVDAGHFQLEMDFANYTLDEHDQDRSNTRFEAGEIAPFNLKFGLLNNLDAQLAVTPWRREETEDKSTGAVVRKRGFGDVTLRAKWNFVGNDGGGFAYAALPFIKLPASADGLGNNSVEGGIKLPCAFEFLGLGISAQTEWDYFRDQNSSGYHSEFVNSISAGRPIWGKLSLAAEFFSSISAETGAGWVGTVDAFLTYEIDENWKVDGGVFFGVTRAADDYQFFMGMSRRF